MLFKFSQALVLAVILVALALLDKELTAQRVFLIMLYLLLAAVFPWLMVPIGVIAIVWQLINGNAAAHIQSFAANFAPQAGPDSSKIGAGSH